MVSGRFSFRLTSTFWQRLVQIMSGTLDILSLKKEWVSNILTATGSEDGMYQDLFLKKYRKNICFRRWDGHFDGWFRTLDDWWDRCRGEDWRGWIINGQGWQLLERKGESFTQNIFWLNRHVSQSYPTYPLFTLPMLLMVQICDTCHVYTSVHLL